MEMSPDLFCPSCRCSVLRSDIARSLRYGQPYHVCEECGAPLPLTVPLVPMAAWAGLSGFLILIISGFMGWSFGPLLSLMITGLPLIILILTAHRYRMISKQWPWMECIYELLDDPVTNRKKIIEAEARNVTAAFARMEQWVARGRAHPRSRERARAWMTTIAPRMNLLVHPYNVDLV